MEYEFYNTKRVVHSTFSEQNPEVLEVVEVAVEERMDLPWRVILYNDEIHTFEEVILQIIKATGCSSEQAKSFALQAHSQGKASVFEGSFEECFRVQGVLREIQLVTEIEG
ncbi:MAG: ATP-dependent Clp protease adaptor ClpS [Rhodothermales bacterium]